ncbi:MAG TPA: ribonuclease R [Vicinamibacteria bacterium]|nr:ribonuclease R [Vicinamibacteria bacterium]
MPDRVLELMQADGKPVSVREVVRRLDLDAGERRELKAVLRRMIDSGEVVKIRGARVGLPSRMNLVVGRLTANPAGYGFVVPEEDKSRRGDVYVSAVNMKEALHGDRVVARVERHTPKGAEGRIIRVLERRMQRIVGRYEQEGRHGGRVVPFDKRVLHELFVPAGEEGGARPGQMVAAEITRPPTATRNPLGRVVEVLGVLGDPGVDLKVVVAKYSLPGGFPADVEAEAARVPQQVRPEEAEGRTDFRSWPTVTVDPENARDHDDAISLDRLPNGHWRLAVHIADVAHYVRPGSLLDQEAYLRGTSVYFPDLVVPMLPHALSSRICSLVEREDRLTQTVVLDLDAGGRVRQAAFHDGVIRSAARMTYQQAQKIVDGDAELRGRYPSLVPLFENMDALAKLMRRRRHERGSLDFDLPEPRLILDASGAMTGVVAAERLDSMRVIEEFMLAANEAVATELTRAATPSLFRIHEAPDPERVEEFAELLSSFGYRLPAKLDEVGPKDFQAVLRQIAGRPEEKLVSYLLLRTMKLARYHEENLGHFGLASPTYSHFTSPIRRYPDLVAHRSLRALRHRRPDDATGGLPAGLPEMGRHLSEMERRATDAERELVEWKKVRFMADKVGDTYAGYVTGVQAFGLFVELDEIYVQGLVHVSSMSDDYYHHDEKHHALRGENTGTVYRLGDRVEVQVARVDLERRQVDFALVDVLGRAASARARGPSRGRPAARGQGSRKGGTRSASARPRGARPGRTRGRR